jgi:hypothetical protein
VGGHKISSAAFLAVKFASSVLNVGVHKTILSDGILPILFKIDKILVGLVYNALNANTVIAVLMWQES